MGLKKGIQTLCYVQLRALTDRYLNLCPTIVSKLYDTLSCPYEKHYYAQNHIWNCDEAGFEVGRNCDMQVIAKRGSKNVPKILHRSREWITILCCVNKIGSLILGFYLFKGKTQLKKYIHNCEPGACMVEHLYAWMTKELHEFSFSLYCICTRCCLTKK